MPLIKNKKNYLNIHLSLSTVKKCASDYICKFCFTVWLITRDSKCHCCHYLFRDYMLFLNLLSLKCKSPIPQNGTISKDKACRRVIKMRL